MESVWILEYRIRDRSNRKWSSWMPMEHESRPTTAHKEKPLSEIVKYPNGESIDDIPYAEVVTDGNRP